MTDKLISLLPALVAAICGFFAHKTDAIFKDIEVERAGYWTRQARYIVGVLSGLPAYLVFREQQTDKTPSGNMQMFLSLWVCVGAGVQLGYLWDYLRGKNGIGRG